MRTIKHCTLTFGSIFVPVAVATSAKRSEIKFRTLHVDCGHPIKQVNRCNQCDMSLSTEDTVKGYEIAKDQFVVIDEDALAAITVPRTDIIELTKFVDYQEIDRNMIERSYYLKPNSSLHKPYELLSTSLAEEALVGIGKATLWGKEFPIAVECDRGILMLRYLFCADELVPGNAIMQVLDFDVPEDEKTMLRQWLNMRKGGLEVEDLTNDSRVRTLEFIEKIAGGAELTKPDPVEAEPVTIDMMAKLKEMVGQA